MQGNQQVIDALNAGLTVELTAINTYFIQARMCKNWGLNKLAQHFYDESIEEMRHAQYLIDRILFLDGVPEIARYDVIRVGQNVPEQLENSLTLEKHAFQAYNEAIKLSADLKDNTSKMVMEQILKESEDSIDWLEAQLHLIDHVGLENYLAMQMGEDSEAD